MQRKLLRKIIVGLCFALPLFLITVVVGEASAPYQEAPAAEGVEEQEDCQSCHGEIYEEWTESMHGQAASDLVFQRAWKREGSPPECLHCHTTGFDLENGTWEEDGVACSVCHAPEVANHPEEIMPTDASSDACGDCHEDTYADWQTSIHGGEELACINCHNPHTTDLKVASSQELCQTCHNEESHFYNLTAHADEGLVCTDCHLRVADAPMLGEGHSQRKHTFEVDLLSCTQCHGDEMHYPVQDAMGEEGEPAGTAEEDGTVVQAGLSLPSSDRATRIVDDEPQSRNPLTYVLAIAAGLGLGIIVTPGLDALYRRVKGE